jgi:hypothetical protein
MAFLHTTSFNLDEQRTTQLPVTVFLATTVILIGASLLVKPVPRNIYKINIH